MLTSHPIGTRYHASREEARQDCGENERVVRLGSFSWGSFGVTGKLRPNGIPVGGSAGGQMPGILVWAVMPN